MAKWASANPLQLQIQRILITIIMSLKQRTYMESTQNYRRAEQIRSSWDILTLPSSLKSIWLKKKRNKFWFPSLQEVQREKTWSSKMSTLLTKAKRICLKEAKTLKDMMSSIKTSFAQLEDICGNYLKKEFDTSLLQKKPSELYRQYVIKFYDKYFKEYESREISDSSGWGNIYFILGLLISNKYSFPNKNDKQRKLVTLFKSVCYKYSKSVYHRFFLSENIWEMFLILLKSGFTDKMIDVYPNLSELKDSYLVVAKDIAYFKNSKI